MAMKEKAPTQPVLRAIMKKFETQGLFESATAHGNGHIHDTYLVKTAGDVAPDYILQRINHHVFRRVPEMMHNIEIVTRHIRHKLYKIVERI